MNRPETWSREVTDEVADVLIEQMVEEQFQKPLQGEKSSVPDFVVINGQPYRVADHL